MMSCNRSLLVSCLLVSCMALCFEARKADAADYSRDSVKRQQNLRNRKMKTRRPSSVEDAEESTNSEFFHQAAPGRIEFTPGLAIISGNGTPQAGGKLTYSGFALQGDVEYGINEMVSVALNLQFSSLSAEGCSAAGTCSAFRVTGLHDPNVDVKFRTPLDTGVFRYGGNVSYAVEKRKVDTSGDYNNATGGSAITPYLGYDMSLGAGNFGVKVSYDLYKGDSQRERGGVSFTVSGGQALALTPYFELPHGLFTFGGAFTYQSMTDQKETTNGQTVSYNDANTQYALNLYMPYRAMPTLTYLPFLRFTSTNYTSSLYSYKSNTEFMLGCNVRLLF